MNMRMMAAAILGLSLLGTPVLAATSIGSTAHPDRDTEKTSKMTPVRECMWLQDQFDTAIKSHAKAAKAAEAMALRSEGGKLCDSGKSNDGIIKLQHAFKDIGMTPTKG